jgi:hypothetical protein
MASSSSDHAAPLASDRPRRRSRAPHLHRAGRLVLPQGRLVTTVGEARAPVDLGVSGIVNLLLIAGIIIVILGSAVWKPGISFDVYGTTLELQNLLRDATLLLIALLSLVLTPNEHREANGFTWEPIAEVAILFAGIFACIVPVLAMLDAGKDGAFAWLLAAVTARDGSPHDIAYFWLTGVLSAFLDNAPTYLVFFETAARAKDGTARHDGKDLHGRGLHGRPDLYRQRAEHGLRHRRRVRENAELFAIWPGRPSCCSVWPCLLSF